MFERTTACVALALIIALPGISLASPEPCSLLTADQVSAALGVPVTAGTSLANGCKWEGSGKEGRGKRATVYLQKAGDFAVGKTLVPGTEKPSINGVGDEAYYGYMTEPRYSKIQEVTLTVRKAAQVLGVQVWGYSVDDAKQKAKALAVDALAKL